MLAGIVGRMENGLSSALPSFALNLPFEKRLFSCTSRPVSSSSALLPPPSSSSGSGTSEMRQLARGAPFARPLGTE